MREMPDDDQTGIRVKIHGALAQAYVALQSAGLVSPLLLFFISWRHLPRRQIVKRILIAVGIFWAIDIVYSVLIVYGVVPCPPNLAGCPTR